MYIWLENARNIRMCPIVSNLEPFGIFNQWIGLRENLQETIVFTIKYTVGFSRKVSPKPIRRFKTCQIFIGSHPHLDRVALKLRHRCLGIDVFHLQRSVIRGRLKRIWRFSWTWGRGWMTKASGVGERRKGRGELRRDCHHHVAALFVPTRMQQWYMIYDIRYITMIYMGEGAGGGGLTREKSRDVLGEPRNTC